jgi:hypothetical protein
VVLTAAAESQKSMLPVKGKWWGNGEPPPTVPYEVTCRCGRPNRGIRQSSHQVIHCQGCQRPLFVLPRSPLLPAPKHQKTAKPYLSAWQSFRVILWPATVTLLVLFMLAGGIAGWRLYWQPGKPGSRQSQPDLSQTLQSVIEEGRKALAAGNFRMAREYLNQARELHQRNPGLLAPAQARELQQLQLQAALLADLLKESLQQVLGNAVKVEGPEWQAIFTDDYRGKAIVFDGRFRRDVNGHVHLTGFFVFIGNEETRLEWNNLRILQHLPLQEPQRLLLGVRLASARREEGGRWVIRFDPDSGVLLTDPGAATACTLLPPDAELHEVLQRQADWLAEQP